MIGSSVAGAIARWFRGPRAILGALALVVTAVFVAGLFTWAYWNPVANTSSLQGALVNEDTPVTVNGGPVNAGNDIATRILDSDTLAWSATTMEQAQRGLDDGTYALVLRIPSDFSANVASLDSGTPAQATIDAFTNDATNYLAGDLAAAAMDSLERSVSADLSLNFIDEVYNALPQAREQGESAVAQSQALSDGLTQAATQGTAVAADTSAVATGISTTTTTATDAAASTKAMSTSAAAAAKSAQDVSSSVTAIATGAKSIDTNLATLEQQLKTKNQPDLAASVAAIRTALDTSVVKPATAATTQATALATSTKQLGTDAETVNTNVSGLATAMKDLTTTAQNASSAAAALSGSLTSTLAPQAAELNRNLADAAGKVPPVTAEQRDAFTTVLAQPVDIVTDRQNEVNAMGEGFAPLFITAALFVGAMVIWLVQRPVNRRMLDVGQSAWRAVVAPWLPGFVWALAQVALLAVGLLALGVSAAAWGALLGMVLLSAVAWLSFVQLLKAAFGGGGHLMAGALLVLGVVGAGGTFPVSTMGGFFAAINPLLPTTYAVDGIRRAIAGGPLTPYLWLDAAVLVAVTLVSLGLTVAVAGRQRQRTAASLQPAIALG